MLLWPVRIFHCFLKHFHNSRHHLDNLLLSMFWKTVLQRVCSQTCFCNTWQFDDWYNLLLSRVDCPFLFSFWTVHGSSIEPHKVRLVVKAQWYHSVLFDNKSMRCGSLLFHKVDQLCLTKPFWIVKRSQTELCKII